MVAAATFIHSRDLTDLTNSRQGNLPCSVSTALSQHMMVYLSNQGDDLLPIVIDSGASISLTANYNDFVGPIRPATITELQGLSHTTKVHGVGQVKWTVRDVLGATRTIKTQAYYVPEATVHLFSPQTYFREQQKGHLWLDHSSTTLQLHDGSLLQFPYNANNNLPLMLPAEPHHIGLTFDDATALGDGHSVHNYMSVADESNQNLTSAQKELLLWHWKLGHANLQWIQTLCREPTTNSHRFVLETHHPKMSSCVLPKCAACMLASKCVVGLALTLAPLSKTKKCCFDVITSNLAIVFLSTNARVLLPDACLTPMGKKRRTTNTMEAPVHRSYLLHGVHPTPGLSSHW